LRQVIHKKDEQILTLQETLELRAKSQDNAEAMEEEVRMLKAKLSEMAEKDQTIQNLNRTIEDLRKEVEASKHSAPEQSHSSNAEELRLRLELEKSQTLIADLKKRLERSSHEPEQEAQGADKKILGVFSLRKKAAESIPVAKETRDRRKDMEEVLSVYAER